MRESAYSNSASSDLHRSTQLRKDEEKILDKTHSTNSTNSMDSMAQISVYFSLHQAECGSQSEASELGIALESIQVLRIPPQLAAVESKAFASSGCGVAKLLVPETVTIIGPNAFRNCAWKRLEETHDLDDDVSYDPLEISFNEDVSFGRAIQRRCDFRLLKGC